VTLAVAAAILIGLISVAAVLYYLLLTSNLAAATSPSSQVNTATFCNGHPCLPFPVSGFIMGANATGTCADNNYPVPCFGLFSHAEIFNCVAAAAGPFGCTKDISPDQEPAHSYTITIWYPYYAANMSSYENCKYHVTGQRPPFQYAYCILLNSTSFVASLPDSNEPTG